MPESLNRYTMRPCAVLIFNALLRAAAASPTIKDAHPRREVTGLVNGGFSVPVYRRAGKVGQRAVDAEYPMTSE
jgi:hypothetical protein